MYQYRHKPLNRPKPYVGLKNRPRVTKNSLPTKYYLWGAGFVIICGSIFYGLFLSSYFRLKYIQVPASRNFASSDLENLVREQIRGRKFLLLRRDNFWLLDKAVLTKAITDKYFFDDLQIKRRWPNKLILNFTEKNYALAWQEGGVYYYINFQGNIIAAKTEATADLPLIYNRGQAKRDGQRINIEEKYLTKAEEINRLWQDGVKGLNGKELVIDDELNTIKVQITGGPSIKFNTEQGIDYQILKLETLRRNELTDGAMLNRLSYIDLRYGDRVFYQ